MDEIKLFYTAVAGLVGMATAVAGWLYSRHLGLESARKALIETHKDLISALSTRLRVHDETIEDLNRRLDGCEKRWDRRRRRDLAEQRIKDQQPEMIG
jgi:hypothetical protein